jgi:hypothetical protein
MITRTVYARAIADVREWSVYRLANEADVMSPDSRDSAGSGMLDSVRSATIDAIDYADTDSTDDIRAIETSEIADSGPSVYTHACWSQFVDLGAYREDISEWGEPDGSDLESIARLALYMVADRLARAIIEYVADTIDSDDSDSADSE